MIHRAADGCKRMLASSSDLRQQGRGECLNSVKAPIASVNGTDEVEASSVLRLANAMVAH